MAIQELLLRELNVDRAHFCRLTHNHGPKYVTILAEYYGGQSASLNWLDQPLCLHRRFGYGSVSFGLRGAVSRLSQY